MPPINPTFGSTFENLPLISWPLDEWSMIEAIVNPEAYRDTWNDYYFQADDKNPYGLSDLLYSSPFRLNLGGDQEKQRIISTDKPNGVFNFSLAAQSLYRVYEYFSQKLADEDPLRFEDQGLEPGIVPPSFIRKISVGGVESFVYNDGFDEFQCTKQQKNTQANKNGKHLPLKFATRTKKIYQTFNRKNGKVKYVEIYSLFHWGRGIANSTSFLIRHIPALIAANYFESIGIKTRVYSTRFVVLSNMIKGWDFVYDDGVKSGRAPGSYPKFTPTLKDKYKGVDLPMYKELEGNKDVLGGMESLVVQPFLSKDYGQELDPLMLMGYEHHGLLRTGYENAIEYIYNNETKLKSVATQGQPTWNMTQYWEGIERYRNKYKQYTELGIWKAKEVAPEAMIFYFDRSIQFLMDLFLDKISDYVKSSKDVNIISTGYYKKYFEMLMLPRINIFFVWWMRMSGDVIRHKISLFNSSNFKKDMLKIFSEMQKANDDLLAALSTAIDDKALLNIYVEYAEKIIDFLGMKTLNDFISRLIEEITIYANGHYFATSQKKQDDRNDLADRLYAELFEIPERYEPIFTAIDLIKNP